MPVPEVTSRDVRVLAAVLTQLLRGQRVSAASVNATSELAPGEAEMALARLDAAGVLHLADGIVRAAYPFSRVPTRHRLSVGGTTAYANCANQKHGLVVLGIGVAADAGDARWMAGQVGATFPIGYDERGDLARIYRLYTVPTTVFVSPAGTITGILEGRVTEKALAQHLARILPAPTR